MASVFHSFARHKELASCRGSLANLSQPGLRCAICTGLQSHLSPDERAFVFLLEPGCISVRAGATQENESVCVRASAFAKEAPTRRTPSPWCMMAVLFLLFPFANSETDSVVLIRSPSSSASTSSSFSSFPLCLFACLYPSSLSPDIFVPHFFHFHLSFPHSSPLWYRRDLIKPQTSNK